ncbi:endonuclease/exonuclease/phosphatase family protein [Halobacteriaceae archaeon SHR40]|uniref:endonuclease/exonuclease/phosphatase family protein n=1 Tax=Halovenus amylolytica TaxID=2500550 RepID=UPI000FE3D641
MTRTMSNPQLKLISWNIERSSIDRLGDQLRALNQRIPDIIALQEFGIKAGRQARELLRKHGFEYAAHSHEFNPGAGDNSSGIAFASRWPFRVLSPDTFDMPYQHHALSAEFYTPFGRIEGHSVHVLPGSMFGIEKIEMFEGIYQRLVADDNHPEYRFLCGDFNSPKEESASGEVTVWGSENRWIEGERSVIVGLAEHDLADAYRTVNGYGDNAYSFVTKNGDNEWRRRFDHMFASEALDPTTAEYLHQYDELSDHTPLEVIFTPEGGIKPHTDEIIREQFNPENITSTSGQLASIDGLHYQEDIRTTNPNSSHQGAFKSGWTKAVNGESMGDALDSLTWYNLGWRLGMLFGEVTNEQKQALYEWCVRTQSEN